MIDERWETLVDKIDEQFGIISYKKSDLYIEADDGKKKKHGYKEVLIFNGRLGEMMLERVSRPLVLDKKVHYSGRKSESRIEYIHSDNEYTHKVIAYLLKDNQWTEIDFRLG